jgi:Holliday junction resolvase RusA-like endonuclease
VKDAIELRLTFPPSLNNYLVKSVRKHRQTGKPYVHVGMSNRAHAYRAQVFGAVADAKVRRTFWDYQRLRVEIILHPPNNGRFDLDNFPKVLQDGLTYSQVWRDDEQIDELVVIRGQKKAPQGEAIIKISKIATACASPGSSL